MDSILEKVIDWTKFIKKKLQKDKNGNITINEKKIVINNLENFIKKNNIKIIERYNQYKLVELQIHDLNKQLKKENKKMSKNDIFSDNIIKIYPKYLDEISIYNQIIGKQKIIDEGMKNKILINYNRLNNSKGKEYNYNKDTLLNDICYYGDIKNYEILENKLIDIYKNGEEKEKEFITRKVIDINNLKDVNKLRNKVINKICIYEEDINNEIEENIIQDKEGNIIRENDREYITIENAMSRKSYSEIYISDFNILGIFAQILNNNNINAVIDINKNNPEKKLEEGLITLEFILNGAYIYKKYKLFLDIKHETIKKFIYKEDSHSYFYDNLKKEMSNILNINKDEILLTDVRLDSFTVNIIIKKTDYKFVTNDELKIKLKEKDHLKYIKDVKLEPLMSACELNLFIFNHQQVIYGEKCGRNKLIGEIKYIPPLDFVGYGLNVIKDSDKEDNRWLGYENDKGEWCVGYFNCLLNKEKIPCNIKFDNIKYDPIDKNKNINIGCIVSTNPEIIDLDKYSKIIKINGNKYKIGLMVRVDPNEIINKKLPDTYWFTNLDYNKIRTYRILIKKV